eukprot:2838502-Amphidinium_carterae.1
MPQPINDMAITGTYLAHFTNCMRVVTTHAQLSESKFHTNTLWPRPLHPVSGRSTELADAPHKFQNWQRCHFNLL